MSKIILVPGSFNPLTNAHIEMALEAKRVVNADFIYFIPTHDNYVKNKGAKILVEDRVALIDSVCRDPENYLHMSVLDIEVKSKEPTKTYQTLKKLEILTNYENEYYLCFGMDNIFQLSSWYKWEDIIKEYKIIACTRDGLGLDKALELANLTKYRDRFIETSIDINTSATKVRNYYKNNMFMKVKQLVPKQVFEYLMNKYRQGDSSNMFNAKVVKNEVVQWIKDFFEENGKYCNAVIGISGGKDSTVVAALCAEALGKDRVLGVLMPNGVQSDINDSISVCEHLGIRYITVNIKDAYADILDDLNQVLITPTEQTKINLAPRIRMTTLYAVSQSLNGRVANTCNLSENFIGYSTRWGDSVGDFAPLAGLTTEEVVAIGDACGLPKYLTHKVPSDGLCGKTDEDNFGFTYETLNRYIRTGKCSNEEAKAKIDHLHKMNLFKHKPIPEFTPVI